MQLIDKILEHPDYIRYLQLNANTEITRQFCHHDLAHAVDVARTAYILSLENGYHLSKELIYITALLHDIAKWKQYQDKSDHAREGAILAEPILIDIGICQDDRTEILKAIESHRTKEGNGTLLSKILYEADKTCRLCVDCKMIKECKRFDGFKTPELNY